MTFMGSMSSMSPPSLSIFGIGGGGPKENLRSAKAHVAAHSVEPAREYVFAPHFVHSGDPSNGANVSLLHRVHLVAPATEECPAEHGVHLAVPACAARYPGAHGVHSYAPPSVTPETRIDQILAVA
eukprot:CAMPEP_0177700376 /NCGR_PEP_ID=MMETSP0484_2-20121128/6063_1 /TAXON_ID=354590 /ORGANISM="Rhodomonas lens, Strain RHODO" /LENGTH=125 /DNA_ID=CAMNT_0019211575 /DNA_START=939 /DNA_END=1316 /DNA_ORIENTATION=-